MNRVKNWSVKLRNFAVSYLGEDFVWGETDCVNLVREALEVMIGEDVLAPVMPGNWTTKIGAMRVYGRIDSFDALLKEAGMVEVDLERIVDGDLVVVGGEGYENMGIVAGSKVITTSEESGKIEAIERYEVDRSARAYRI